ncbi:MAG TPA: fasciclin domain-containing protein [Mucilaginibacter sp.]|jgi:uncharacterized surface protein with fasciclin (FAS1) repeats|nr:fasciclin domain-containing protein [Mucilaginibacter sp.]
MRKLILLICMVLYGGALFAQSPQRNDSLKISKLKPSTLKKPDGAAMLSVNDIATNISASKELVTFYRIIQAAGITETFKSKGPITVFAPTEQAFAGLPAGKLDTLFHNDHKYDLIALVTYHALPGIVTSGDIVHQINISKGLATFITLTGNKLMAKLDANRNIVLIDENGGQSIINRFNIKQNNGLIHLINSVLIPKFKNI